MLTRKTGAQRITEACDLARQDLHGEVSLLVGRSAVIVAGMALGLRFSGLTIGRGSGIRSATLTLQHTYATDAWVDWSLEPTTTAAPIVADVGGAHSDGLTSRLPGGERIASGRLLAAAGAWSAVDLADLLRALIVDRNFDRGALLILGRVLTGTVYLHGLGDEPELAPMLTLCWDDPSPILTARIW